MNKGRFAFVVFLSLALLLVGSLVLAAEKKSEEERWHAIY